MRGSVVRGIRLAAIVGVIGLAAGQFQAQASVGNASRAAGRQGVAQPTAQLVYQGKILPIVTDVYNSIDSLSTALNNRSVPQVAVVAGEFSYEKVRLEAVRPVPGSLKNAALQLDQGISNLSTGTTQLVTGLKASDSKAVQAAATVLDNGLKEFQSGVSIVRRLAGPLTVPTPSPKTGSAGPQPTPIIRGLP